MVLKGANCPKRGSRLRTILDTTRPEMLYKTASVLVRILANPWSIVLSNFATLSVSRLSTYLAYIDVILNHVIFSPPRPTRHKYCTISRHACKPHSAFRCGFTKCSKHHFKPNSNPREPTLITGKIMSAVINDQYGAIPQAGTAEIFNIGIPGSDGLVLPVKCNITWDDGSMTGAPTI